jgi:hypothetical protein
MIRRSIAIHRGVAKLTPEATAIFCMVIPHLSGHGKMLAEPGIIKQVCLPFTRWATVEVIERSLKEISRRTNLKYFKGPDGRRYLHALSWAKHQILKTDKLGANYLPDFRKCGTKSCTKFATKFDPEGLRLKEEGGKENKTLPPPDDAKGGASPLKDDPNQLSPGAVPTNGVKPSRATILGLTLSGYQDWYRTKYGEEPKRITVGNRHVAIARALADLGYEHLSRDEQNGIPQTWN